MNFNQDKGYLRHAEGAIALQVLIPSNRAYTCDIFYCSAEYYV